MLGTEWVTAIDYTKAQARARSIVIIINHEDMPSTPPPSQGQLKCSRNHSAFGYSSHAFYKRGQQGVPIVE
jgi:hypothetical protein